MTDAAATALSEETSDEKHMKLQISECEKQCLERAFAIFCGDRAQKKSFDAEDLRRVLLKLTGKSTPQQRLDLLVWEVDENLDKRVDEHEFELMYKKCIEDKTGIEPRALFHLAQFLMFCPDEEGRPKGEFRPNIMPEDTYFLVYARLDRQLVDESKRARLDEEVEMIFCDDPSERRGRKIDLNHAIDFDTYYRRMLALDLKKWTTAKEAQKHRLKNLAATVRDPPYE